MASSMSLDDALAILKKQQDSANRDAELRRKVRADCEAIQQSLQASLEREEAKVKALARRRDEKLQRAMLPAGGAENTSKWPLHKFRTALAARDQSPSPDNGFAVLLTTGAMNPIHLGHVQLLHQARERLEQCGFGVVGAWASPSHDGYVQPKCKALNTWGLTSAFRVEVATRAVENDSLVAVGSWEAEFPDHWPHFTQVTQALQKELSQLPEAGKLVGPRGYPQIFYACGTDHAEKCGLYRGMGLEIDFGVVVVPRSDERPRDELPCRRVYVAQAASGTVAGLSSSQVRAALQARDFGAAGGAMSAPAARFLLQPTREEYDLYERDGQNYSKLGVSPP